jgi:hypothetical protein
MVKLSNLPIQTVLYLAQTFIAPDFNLDDVESILVSLFEQVWCTY